MGHRLAAAGKVAGKVADTGRYSEGEERLMVEDMIDNLSGCREHRQCFDRCNNLLLDLDAP